jgi:hypothetical protein
MAIGDTVQAGLMRIDTSAYERAGQANANANQAFGNALNQVAKGFIEGQEKRARAEEMTGYLMNQGVSEKDAKAIAKNPFLQKEYQRKKATEAQMQMEGNRLQMEAQKLAAQQRSSASQAFQKNREMDMKEELFRTQQNKIREDEENEMGMAEALLAETTDPAVLEDYNQAQPGLFALGGDQGARNRFLEFQRDEAPKVLGGELGSSDFGRYAREQNLDPVLAKNRFMELQKAEAEANQGTGKTMTINNPATGQNVIAQQNPDGSPGNIVALAPTQPRRILTPEETRKVNINQTEDKQAMDTETLWRERAIDGQNTMQTVKSALSTLEKAGDTGGFNKYINSFKNYAASAGVEFSKDEMERLGQASKFEQLSGEFLFKAISQTKGAISNKEMQIFERISPGMVNTKRGNQLMLEYARDRAKRDVKLNQYLAGLKANGMLPQERVLAGMEWLNDPENDITKGLNQLVTNQAQNPQSSQPMTTPSGWRIKKR